MGIRIIKEWPRTASERAVEAWFVKKGINYRNVRGYEIKAEQKGASTILVDMYFDEDEDAEVTGLNKAEREFLPTNRE
jgi:hypothetical protein